MKSAIGVRLLVVTAMAFDPTVFARWNLRARYFLREMRRRNEFDRARPNLGPAWAIARSEVANLTKKAAGSLLTRLSEGELERLTERGKGSIEPRTVFLLSLVKRLHAFPDSLHYEINRDRTILIYSSDRELERALYFGTRELPRLRPIDFLVARMLLRLQDSSLVFTARDFRKAHEIEQDFKRENLRQVTPYYS
jgi:hypothetical protein